MFKRSHLANFGQNISIQLILLCIYEKESITQVFIAENDKTLHINSNDKTLMN